MHNTASLVVIFFILDKDSEVSPQNADRDKSLPSLNIKICHHGVYMALSHSYIKNISDNEPITKDQDS